jgi:hypothetical protein
MASYKIDASFVDRLKGVGAAKSFQTGHNAEMKITHLTQSTVPHVDQHIRAGEIEGEVSLVFWNDNPNACFRSWQRLHSSCRGQHGCLQRRPTNSCTARKWRVATFTCWGLLGHDVDQYNDNMYIQKNIR